MKKCIMLAVIFVMMGLSFAVVALTDRYMYINYLAYACKANYASNLLEYGAGYATDGGDTGLASALTGMQDDLLADVADMQGYILGSDRAGFSSVLPILRQDTSRGLSGYRAARRTAISGGWTDKATARSNEAIARAIYSSCVAGGGPITE